MIGRKAAIAPAVDITFTVKSPDCVALTASVAGTLQVNPLGAPVQLSEAVPLTPAPPIESKYLDDVPAVIVVELKPPVAILRPKPWETPVPVKETICGLLGALSEMVRVPFLVPVAVGANVT